MTDRKKIEARIAELRSELGRVEGTPTEVYSRIVGYYRSVRNWNAGKREEYKRRLVFDMPSDERNRAPSGRSPTVAQASPAPATMAEPTAASLRDGVLVFTRESEASPAAELRDGFLVFTREACPNCPPVKNYVQASGIKAVFVDVDEDAGFALAREHGVMATPTVLALDGEGRESFRAFDIASLQSGLEQGLRGRFEAGAQAKVH